jgi:hypothetical protein
LDKEFLALLDKTSSHYKSVTTSAMIDSVYLTHPWFALHSEVMQRRAVNRPPPRQLCSGEISCLSAMYDMWCFRNFPFILLSQSAPYTRLQKRL